MRRHAAVRAAFPLCWVVALGIAPPRAVLAEARGTDTRTWAATAVSCATCLVPNSILIDGFETNGTCAWSARVGSPEACLATCGDCVVGETEFCDLGTRNGESACPYNTLYCLGCNASCNQTTSLVGPYCGDGQTQTDFELCDDGNFVTESECPYGTSSCELCDSSCQEAPSLAGPYCGDGIVDAPYEDCDDRNVDACGSCSSDCSTLQSAYATGLIVAVESNRLADGESITLSDGFFGPAVFEFDLDRTCCADESYHAVSVDPGTTEIEVAKALSEAIGNALELSIAAQEAGPLVLLTHERAFSLGNQQILESVGDPGFFVVGMTGGLGGDCLPGVACASDADCASWICADGFCVVPSK